MYETPLSRQLGELRSWQQSRLRLLMQLRPWLHQQGLDTDAAVQAVDQAVNALRDDRITVAVAGEFSRGKTELLNALFFADLGCRLLPADAGRTTMCPTEIFHDPGDPPQLRLLPIETRREEHALSTLRDDPTRWQVFPLPLDNADGLSATLQKLTEQQRVSHAQAAELGLPIEPDAAGTDSTDIPRWRLAQLNIPHPLLTQGLRVLDTPGLNAIGSEPELTYEMLPAAHAVLFILGADTGVTRSDMEIWQRFVRGPAQKERPGLLVVLNKTDTLWDELRSPGQIAESIFSQCRSVAETLAIDPAQIFAVSAQKALLARIQGRPSLEHRSGISGLERYLGGMVSNDRLRLVQDVHTRQVLRSIDDLETLVRNRMQANSAQRRELLDLASRSDAAIVRMLHGTQSDFAHYQSTIDAYRRRLQSFRAHGRKLLAALDTQRLDQSLEEIHRDMTGAWTTMGLREAMRVLFDQLNARIEEAGTQAQMMRRILRSTYRYLEREYDFKVAAPAMLSIVRYQVELSLLDQEAETFRNSPRTTLMEQHFVTRRYFDTIVTRVRRIIGLAQEDAQAWADKVMSPLSAEVRGYRDGLAQRIVHLQATAESRKTIQTRINILRRDSARQQAQLKALDHVRQTLRQQEQRPSDRVSGQN